MDNTIIQELTDVVVGQSGNHFDCNLTPLKNEGNVSLYRLEIKAKEEPKPTEENKPKDEPKIKEEAKPEATPNKE